MRLKKYFSVVEDIQLIDKIDDIIVNVYNVLSEKSKGLNILNSLDNTFRISDLSYE